MPNAAKLVGALAMAVVALVASHIVMGLFSEETNFGWFREVNAGLGLLVGWHVIGARAGRGTVPAINVGLTAPVVLVFWALFVQSCNEMVGLAMKNRYGDPFEALVAIFEIGSEWALMLVGLPLWAVLLGGGVLAGLAAEYASKTWR